MKKITLVTIYSTATHRNCLLGIGKNRREAIEDAGGHYCIPKGANIFEWDASEAALTFPYFNSEIHERSY